MSHRGAFFLFNSVCAIIFIVLKFFMVVQIKKKTNLFLIFRNNFEASLKENAHMHIKAFLFSSYMLSSLIQAVRCVHTKSFKVFINVAKVEMQFPRRCTAYAFKLMILVQIFHLQEIFEIILFMKIY